MPATTESDQERSPGEIELPPTLTIRDIAAHHRELCEAVGEATSILIDAGGVERVDTCGLQCLAALVRTASDRGCPVSWKRVSRELDAGARRLGLEHVLMLPATDIPEEN